MKEDTDKTWIEVHGGFAKDMTLRDHYAALAMQAQLSMPELCVAIGSGSTTVAALCGSCFEWADAMLKAREK
jgi:hypothetical protein